MHSNNQQFVANSGLKAMQITFVISIEQNGMFLVRILDEFGQCIHCQHFDTKQEAIDAITLLINSQMK